jgi:drug/metabolite transporter (DMT)-like permease
MGEKLKKRSHFIRKIPGQAYLWLAVLIFGASNAVTRKLTEIGAENFIGDRNPISLCNVLLVGNLCALLVLITIYWQQWNQTNLQQLSKQDWFYLSIVAILSGAIAPGLIFQALALTNVNNIILVGRLEPPLIIALSIYVLKENVSRWQIFGSLVAFLGVALTIFLQTAKTPMVNMGGFTLGLGEILAAIVAIITAISTIIGKQKISHIPAGIYNIYRTALGSIIFFFIALILYGSDHFMDVFSPFLWKWMLVYGAIIVVLGQSFWLKGLRSTTTSEASLAGSMTPLAGILAAYLILGELPNQAQYWGGSLILLGIILSQIGIQRQLSIQRKSSSQNSLTKEQMIESSMGFKGL